LIILIIPGEEHKLWKSSPTSRHLIPFRAKYSPEHPARTSLLIKRKLCWTVSDEMNAETYSGGKSAVPHFQRLKQGHCELAFSHEWHDILFSTSSRDSFSKK
jgi:hypothetical protein